jgi:PAS domain S-box-containing protein
MRLFDVVRRAPTIRQWLALLLAAFIVPAALAVVTLAVHGYQRERAGVERANLDVARARMQAIDRELASAQAAMQALATSPNLDRPDFRRFYDQAIDVLHSRPGNVLLLLDDRLRQVVNTHMPFGAALPKHGDPVQLRQVFDSGRPSVSDLYVGPTVRRLLTSVDVPVLRQGRVSYVLSMQYFGERLGAILERQQIPARTSATIYDSAGRIIWRDRGSPGDVGRRAEPALAAALLLEPEGIVDDTGPDGRHHVTAFSRSAVSKWAVAIALQRSDLNAVLWNALAWITLGALCLLTLGLALTRMIGAHIERSMHTLVEAAMALGYGEPVVPAASRLREAKEVGHALVQAAALLRERTAQRDDAERAERGLREANRAIERSEAFLRGIFEETPDGVVLVDADCRVTRANGQAERLFGYAPGALEGVAVDRLLVESGPGAAPVSARVRSAPLRRGTDGTMQLHGRRRDGTTFPADAMASPLRERELVIVTVRDMTETWEQEEALRGALEDKNTLLRELYHRVKNNLQLIISLFNLQVRSLPDDQARQALVDAAGRVRAMALVHERLYQSGSLSSIRLDGYVSELCAELAGAAAAPQRGIAVRAEAVPLEVGLDVAVPLGLLLNELVTNSLKHAFPEGRHGTVRVRLEHVDAGRVRLTVSDDGVGLPPDRTSRPTLGLKLVSALSDQLRAEFTLDNRDGAVATLEFRVPGSPPGSARRPVFVGATPAPDDMTPR